MNHWPLPVRAQRYPHAPSHWHLVLSLARREPFIFLPLALLAGLLLAPRAGNAQEAPTYELTVEHQREARTVTHTIDDPPLAADFAPQVLHQSDSVSRWPGWLTLGVGAVAIGVGANMTITAIQDGLALRQSVQANPLAYAAPTSQQAVVDKAASLNSQVTLGAGVAVAGVAAAGVGAWLLLRQPSRRAAMVPTGQGALLVVAF